MENKSILFVCLGNICRSPLAQGIAQKYCKEKNLNLKIDSAGTGDWHISEPPCEDSIKIAQMNGINISEQRARQITKHDIKNYDFIIGLDSKNILSLKHLGCLDPILLGDYGYEGEDIPDPYFFDGFEGFDKVFEMIKVCVENLIKHCEENSNMPK